MLSPVNNYGGLSATQLLTLLGVNASSSSASSNAAQTSRAAWNEANGSAPAKPDPASAIKSILAQSQIDQSSISVLGGSTTANAEGVTQSSEYLDVTRAPIGLIIDQSAYATITSSNSIAAMTYNEVIGVHENVTIVNAGVVSAGAPNAPAQTNSPTTIQFGRSIANSSVNIGFSVDNLGPVIVNDGIYSPLNPQGTYQVNLQLDFDAAQGTANEGESCTAGGQDINFSGLTASQAQDILTGFEKATGDANTNSAAGSVYTNTENLAGMDVAFSGVVYGGPTSA
jgi:hypothetical protein